MSATPIQSLPTLFTIFGITGDLSKRKLLPAIYQLFVRKLLPKDIHFIGISHHQLSAAEFTSYLQKSITESVSSSVDQVMLKKFSALFTFIQGDFSESVTYNQLQNKWKQQEEICQSPHQLIFYLATAPQFFISIIEHLAGSGLSTICDQNQGSAKIVIEKPFGKDTVSARLLNDAALKYVKEEQIYRMDHYLGKETVQNILLFRFTNPVINDSWNPQAIDHIQITAGEDLGVEQRGYYYDQAGAVRDMIQSHCLGLLPLVTMSEPTSLESSAIHTKKQEILNAIQLYKPTDISKTALRAQYNGYRTIPYVKPNSTTETYAAVRLRLALPEWSHVPIFIQTGKRLKKKATTISIHFSACQSNICKTEGIQTEPNVLKIRIQPQEGIALRLYAKQPGFSIATEQVDMDFSYTTFASEQSSPYERLIHDVIIGDRSLFPSTQEVMQQWQIVQPILDAWQDNAVPLYTYEPNTWGPPEAAKFIAQHNGIKWHT